MKQLTLEEYKQVELDILIKVDKICRENNIKYFLFAGTLIGAVRHQGFIPWDDDIDISMLREDYNKLANIIQNGNYGLNFIRIEENPDTIYPYGKICDQTTEIEEKNFKEVKGYGVFIDVFPFDYLPEDDEERARLKKKYFRMYQLLTHSSRTGYVKTDSLITNIKRSFAFHLSKLFSTKKLITKMNYDFVKLNENKSNLVGLAWAFAWLLEDYQSTTEVIFEGHTFLAPKNPDRVLKTHFGDYMKLPPENERIIKHTLICYKK